MQHLATSLILKSRLVAILRLDDLSDAIPLTEALLAGGVRALEFTLTNPQAPQAIADCLERIPAFREGQATLGLGSVRNLDEAQIAIECGAQFVVAPITNMKVIERCLSHSIPISPGAFTPTEIYQAHVAGAEIIKVFPARGLGPNYIKDVLAPMPFLKLMPTGGIDINNAGAYFKAGAVAVGVGGQFLDPSAIAESNWQRISELSKAFVDSIAP